MIKSAILWCQAHLLVVIIVVSGAVRLIGISSPLIGVHSWRQTDTAAMARNFANGDMNILRPQVDWGGNGSGWVESEFPIMPYFVALLYRVIGFSDIWGRLVSIISSLFVVYFLYRFVELFSGPRVAAYSAAFWGLLPLNVFYGRAFMPESAMLACSVAGLYFFARWTSSLRSKDIVFSAICISLAALLKLPALYLGLPLAFMAWTVFGRKMLTDFRLWLYAIAILLPVAAWYYHAHQAISHGGVTFGIWEYGSDKWGNWSLVMSLDFWNRILFQSIAERHLAWFGLPILVMGLALKRASKKERVFDAWLIAIFVYVLLVAKGNYVHEYYQLPAMLPLCFFVGRGADKYLANGVAKSKASIAVGLCILGILTLGAMRYSLYLSYEDPTKSKELKLSVVLNETTAPGTLVGVFDRLDPTILYHSDRKGWHLLENRENRHSIDSLANLGVRAWGAILTSFDNGTDEKIRTLIGRDTLLFDDGDIMVVGMRIGNER